jgi:hypothetical protein
MNKLIKLGLIIAGATVLTFTMASATADETPKTMKCGGGDKDENKETNTTKPAPEKGKCGTGKCG